MYRQLPNKGRQTETSPLSHSGSSRRSTLALLISPFAIPAHTQLSAPNKLGGKRFTHFQIENARLSSCYAASIFDQLSAYLLLFCCFASIKAGGSEATRHAFSRIITGLFYLCTPDKKGWDLSYIFRKKGVQLGITPSRNLCTFFFFFRYVSVAWNISLFVQSLNLFYFTC